MAEYIFFKGLFFREIDTYVQISENKGKESIQERKVLKGGYCYVFDEIRSD